MKRRNTPAKTEVLSMFENTDVALSQDMIEQKMAGSIDRVTIYRILNSFYEDGIIHRITSDEGKHYYALCATCKHEEHHHNHFHFRCLNCQNVECLKQETDIRLPKGYVMEDANLMISGYCKRCSA